MNLFDLYSYAQNMFVLANISVFIIEKDSIIKMGVIGRLSWGGGIFGYTLLSAAKLWVFFSIKSRKKLV